MWEKQLKTLTIKSSKGMAALLISTSMVGALSFNPVNASSLQGETLVQVANSKKFKDVRANYWAADSINWASSIGIINGYNDGTFKPGDTLTEAQFAAVLTRYYADLSKEASKHTKLDSKVWSNSTYESLARYKVPLLGYTDNFYRNSPVKRGLIAQVISHVQGNTSDLKGAIQYLFDEGITVGQNSNGKDIFEKYGNTNHLTRAEVVVFFHRLHQQGKTTVSDVVVSGKLPTDGSVAAVKKGLVSTVDKSVVPAKPGVTIKPPVVKPPVTNPPVVSKTTQEVVNIFKGAFGSNASITTIDNMVALDVGDRVALISNYYDGKHIIMIRDRSYDSKAYSIMKSLGLPLSESELNAAYKDSLSKRGTVTVKGVDVSGGLASATVEWK